MQVVETSSVMATFLDIIDAGYVGDSYRAVWYKPTRMTRSFQQSDHRGICEQARKWAGTGDVYIGACLLRSRPESGRGTEADVGVLTTVWVDIDFAGPNHAETSLPPSLEDALGLLESVGLPPTLIISTGCGIHAYWVLVSPWVLEFERDRRSARNLVDRVQGVIIAEGAKHCWNLDWTSDLARVLRLPGTFNHKGAEPVLVELLECHPDRRYSRSDFDQLPNLISQHRGEVDHSEIAHGVIANGKRNSTLTSIGGSFRKLGFDQETIRQGLATLNPILFASPLPSSELETIARSVSKYAPASGPGISPRTLESLASIPASSYLALTLPEQVWIVPDLLPEGLTVLAGAFKMGKSWLALSLCLAVAAGGRVFNAIRCERRRVVYLTLEDGLRRMKSRLGLLMDQGFEIPEDLRIYHDWPRFDEGGHECLEKLLSEDPDLKLVVIDVWQRVRPPKRTGADSYETDYQTLGILKGVADKHHAAIMLVHHIRKMEAADPFERISGSVAIPGCADTSWVLIRGRGAENGELHVTGRDIDEQQLAMRFENCVWTLGGDLQHRKLRDGRASILEVLTTAHVSLSPRQIAVQTQIKECNVRQTLRRMVDAGEIANPSYGKYSVKGVTGVTVDELTNK